QPAMQAPAPPSRRNVVLHDDEDLNAALDAIDAPLSETSAAVSRVEMPQAAPPHVDAPRPEAARVNDAAVDVPLVKPIDAEEDLALPDAAQLWPAQPAATPPVAVVTPSFAAAAAPPVHLDTTDGFEEIDLDEPAAFQPAPAAAVARESERPTPIA